MNRESTLAFDVYKNTLRRANGFRPVSGGRGYSKIVCRFRENDWATEGDLLSAGFYVTTKHVIGVSGTVVANTDDNAPETARLLAEFTIPTDILRQKLPFYFGIAGVYEEGNIVIATNTVRVDTARSIVVDELSGNEEIMSNYEMLMGVLNDKAEKTYVDNQDVALEQRVNTVIETARAALESSKEDKSNKLTRIGIGDVDSTEKYPSAKALIRYLSDYYYTAPTIDSRIAAMQNSTDQALAGKEDSGNKVGSMTQGNTGRDSTVIYPNVQAVRDFVDGKLELYALESEIPEAVSELDNDAGYLTEQDISGKANLADVYTKSQTDQALAGKTDNVTTTKNRAEVLGGAIAPEMERGYISSQNGGEYQDDSYNRFVRTKEGYDMWLNPGAVIRLTDYSDARLTVKYIPSGGSFQVTDPLSIDFTVTQFGLYRFLITGVPTIVNGNPVFPPLSDQDVETLKGLVRVTNPTVYGMTEADAPAPLLLGRGRYKAVYVDFTVSNGAVTMTIPPGSGIVTTNGVIPLGNGDSDITVNCVQSGYERVKVVYDKSDGTVKSVPHTDNAYTYILIAVVCCYTDTSALFYKVPAEVHINAPYRINNRCMGLPFSEVLTPIAVGYDPGAKRNYVEVDTVNKQIIFPAGTMIFAGESNGFVALNNGNRFVLDYSNIALGNSAYYGVMKLYFDVNSQQVFIVARNSIQYGAYPLVAIVRVPQSASDSTKPSLSINAPAVIDGKPNGYSDPSQVNNALLKNINHRGYNTVAPENTLPAFRLSKKKGFAVVETDVQRTSDGVYVCLHDRSINRTARNADGTEISGTVNIDEITYTQAAAYDFGIWKSDAYAGTKIPTLVQFVRLCRNIGLEMYIELKEETITTQAHVSEIVAIVKENGMLSHCTFISFLPSHLFQVLIAAPTARIGFLCNNAEFDNIKTAKLLRGDTFTIDVQGSTSTFNTTQKGTNDVFIDLPCDVTSGTALSLAIAEDFPAEVWVVSSNAEPNFININPYVTGFTSNKELGSNALYERYI